MKMQKTITCAIALCALLLTNISGRAASPLATGFSYQGRLFDQGVAANGRYDMIFILRDQASGGSPVGSGVSLVPVAVSNGLFQATLDFGTNVWDGAQLWLDVSVRSNGVAAAHVLLTPSQLIQPVPYAIHAIKAGELVGPLPGGQLSGVYSNVVNFSSGLNAFSGSGAGLTSLNAGQLTGGLVPDARLAAGIARDSELLSVSNSLAGRLNLDSSSLSATITGTSNGLSARLVATEASLGARIGTTSNSLRTAIDGEAFQRTALQTQLSSGDNLFSGSNLFLGVTLLTNGGNVVAGEGSGLFGLNASAIAGGTVPDARLSGAVARTANLLAVSNDLAAVQFNEGQSNVFLGQLILSTDSRLTAALLGTNAALMMKITTSSNALQTAIDAEAAARAALVTLLQTGDNSFAGSNHFSGVTVLTNGNNVLAGDGSALTGLNGSAISFGTVADGRIDAALARDSELLSVSNALSGQLTSNNSSVLGTINTTSNGLNARLVATNAALVTLVGGTDTALMAKITTSSNALQSAVDAEAASRVALAAQLQTGANTFAGSNHFSGVTVLTNGNNVLAGDGSALTGLNGSAISFGTVADGRIDAALARDSELLSVSNALSGQLTSNNGSVLGTINTTSNGLSARLVATNSALIGFLDATNAALMSQITTSSNALDTAIGNEATARTALATQFSTGNNSFSGSNHFSGIALLTNTANILAGDGSGLLSLNASQISSGTLSLSRLPSQVVVDDGESGINFGGSVSAPSFSGGGSGLTSLNASQLSSGTVADARIDATLTRDTELNSVSNTIAGNLDATNTALMSQITATSNALDTAIGNEATARAALVTQLGTGDNAFAGSNHFSGITLLTNTANILAGEASGLTGLNADQLTSGTVNASRLPAGAVIDDAQSGVTLMGNLTAPSFSGDGSSLTALNASSLTSGTVAAARLDAAITRDSELNSVSNIIAGNFAAADTALMSTIITTSNALDTAVANEATARTALQTQLQTGNNSFAGSNHYSGLIVATNVGNVLNGDGAGLTGLWKTGGNSGTTPETQFIGTSDAQPVVLKVNNERALRLEEGSAGAPNFIGGSRSNLVGAGVYGATISGGGAVSDNEVIEPNTVAANFATISGGKRNDIGASAQASVIGGGEENVVSANAVGATVGGGVANRATNSYATVPGGHLNRAGGQYSFAAGRSARADADGAFVWADSQGSAFATTTADSFNIRAQGGLNVQAGTATIAFVGGAMTLNGNSILTNGQGAVLGANNAFGGDNTFNGTNVFAGSNHFSSIVIATNPANVIQGNGSGLTGLWKTGGNSGTTPGTDFLGSTDNQAVVFKANNKQIMRLTPAPDEGAPNILLGAEINFIASTVYGSTISGGGAAEFMSEGTSSNRINASYSTIGGGVGNIIEVDGYAATIGGGIDNIIYTNADRSIIGGGTGNEVVNDTYAGTIGGGSGNFLNTDSDYSVIAGGRANSSASQYGAVGGGRNNGISGLYGTVAGGLDNDLTSSADYSGVMSGNNNDIAGATYAFIGGGLNNSISSGSTHAAIAGGKNNAVSGISSTIAGGEGNVLGAKGSFIGSGLGNNVTASGGFWSFLGAGVGNSISANVDSGAIVAGQNNTNGASYGLLGAGLRNTINSGNSGFIGAGEDNSVSGAGGVIGGGRTNATTAGYAGVLGGANNTAGGSYSFVGGGQANINSGNHGVVSGGNANNNTGLFASIGGGTENTNSGWYGVIAGGGNNVATASFAVASGGRSNTVSGLYAAVPGGSRNQASSDYAFAAGYRAKAGHKGAFVWGDSQDADHVSVTNDTFNVRANSGLYFTATNRSQIYINGVRLMNVNDDGFAQSDRNVKKNFRGLDTIEVVEKLAAMPVEYWNYKKETDDAVPHIGPYAQDFKSAFYPGRDDKKISWLEFHGVELAAIQGLNKKLERSLEQKDAEIAKLRDEMEALKQMVRAMSRAGGTQ